MRPLAVLLLAAACAPANGTNRVAPSCGADGLQGWVGHPLASADLPLDQITRVIEPGQPVDDPGYAPERLTVETDRRGTIVRIRCG